MINESMWFEMRCGNDINTSSASAVGVIAVIDCALLGAGAYGWIWLWFALAMHCALLAAGAGWTIRNGRGDRALWAIGLLTILLTGPLGVTCALGLALFERYSSPSMDSLNEWYRQISGGSAPDSAYLVHEAIVTGRAVRPDLGGLRNFLEVIKHGTLSEKQALLGLVGLKYHADYFPVLMLALRSPEASVRAQAAAVFVKLKEQFNRHLEQSLAGPSSDAQLSRPAVRLARAAAILACTESGFIDAVKARDARSVAKALCEAEISKGSSVAEILFCRLLAANDEHAELVGRLAGCARTLPMDLKSLLAESLIILGRHLELHDLLSTMTDDRKPVIGQAPVAGAASG